MQLADEIWYLFELFLCRYHFYNKQTFGSIATPRRQYEHADTCKALFECNFCQKLLLSAQSLIDHKRSIHWGTRFLCPICRVNLKSRKNFKKHVEHHSAGKIKNKHIFNCTLCPKRCKTKDAFDMHMMAKHGAKATSVAVRIKSGKLQKFRGTRFLSNNVMLKRKPC